MQFIPGDDRVLAPRRRITVESIATPLQTFPGAAWYAGRNFQHVRVDANELDVPSSEEEKTMRGEQVRRGRRIDFSHIDGET
jgi:hypothetical protein